MATTEHLFLESIEKSIRIRSLSHYRELVDYFDADGKLDRRSLVVDLLVDIELTPEETDEMLSSVGSGIIENAVIGMYLPGSGAVGQEMAELIADPIFGPSSASV